ncbi:hypothetical protein JCM10908_005227 [Rhodotorula pacifica]|uniref:glutathione S-transferase family protein n=1 Tax=Rhodotorula pacifica TaxID=1495444 RepID=UPI00317A4514
MPAKLYGFAPRTLFARLAAEYEGADVEWIKVNPFTDAVPDSYKEKFPLGLIPGYEDGDFKLSECIAVASYIARENKAGLLGKTDEERYEILSWCSFANDDMMALYPWFWPLTGAPWLYLKPAVEAEKAKALKSLAYVEGHLATRTFLVGERITLADLPFFAILGPPFATVLDAEFRKSHPNVVRHYNTIAHQPKVVKMLSAEPAAERTHLLEVGPEPVFCEKAAVHVPPKGKKGEKPSQAVKALVLRAHARAHAEGDKRMCL